MDNKKLIKKTPSLCIYPWIHLEANALGSIRPCCQNILTIKDASRDAGGFYWKELSLSDHNTTLEDAYTSPDMINLRRKFLNNERPDVCYKCWTNEKTGMRSLRQAQTQSGFFDIEKVDLSADPSFATNMQSVDLKLGTTCNLQCRICDIAASSKFRKETKTILKELGEVDGRVRDRTFLCYDDVRKHHRSTAGRVDEMNEALTHVKLNMHRSTWPNNEAFYDNLKIIFPNLKFMEFFGGEPFLIKKHFEVLKYAIEKGYSKNIVIKYNTNGTQYPKELVEDIFPHFNSVLIHFSIDDVAERFEYQRYPAKWEQVKDNIQRFTELTNVNLKTEICITVSIFNILSLDELLGWVNTTNLDGIYFNILYDPQDLNIQSLDEHVKHTIIEKFKTISWNSLLSRRLDINSSSSDLNENIQTLINFMLEKHITIVTSGHQSFYGKAVNGPVQEVRNWRIQTFDKLRNENFVKTFPELAELIGYD